jgi:hypothetical protein
MLVAVAGLMIDAGLMLAGVAGRRRRIKL